MSQGVITKVDMVAKCTEQTIVKMVSEPAKYRIHKGFFLVKLRSQEDLVNEMTLEEAIENETRYFREQVQYRCVQSFINFLHSHILRNVHVCKRQYRERF